MVLLLQWVFGLRLKEAALLHPHLADQGSYIDIARGTKGGRARVCPVASCEARGALDAAKAFVGDRNGSFVPKGTTYRSYQNRVYYILRKHGISRSACGVSTHGLRHEALNDLYEKIAGVQSPVRGGKAGEIAAETDRFARAQVAEAAGHSRARIAGAYLGSVLGHPRGPRQNQSSAPVLPVSNADSTDQQEAKGVTDRGNE